MKIQKLVQNYGMTVQLVDRSKIKANAVVVRLPAGGYLVFMDRGLPDNIKLFSLAHEAAHIDLELFYTQTSSYDAETEKRVDRRAIELLEDALLPEKHGELAAKARIPDNSLYDCLAGTDVFTAEALLWSKAFWE